MREAAGVTSGQVVILNGASSAGKSTLANAAQAALAAAGRPWVVFSWDDFVPRLPERWHGGPDVRGDDSADGCAYRLLRTDPPEALLEVGEVGRRLLAGYHRAVAGLAAAGVDVLVEEVLITRWEWDDWAEALGDVDDVRWVAVRCDVETAVAREVARGDRYPGLARGTSAVVHDHPAYDVELDTTTTAAEELAAALVATLET